MSELDEFLDEWEAGDVGIDARPTGDCADVSGMLGPGVYGLCHGEVIVYVGKARLLIQRLYSHSNTIERLRKGKPALKGMKAIYFNRVMIWPCRLGDLDRVEREMIARYRPRRNSLLKPEGKVSLEAVGFDLTRLRSGVSATPMFRRRV